jgi:hypothetical protein
MARICSNCSTDITYKPEFDGLRGSLCFKCKYTFDEFGGEAYFFAKREYEKRLSVWESEYGAKWAVYNQKLIYVSYGETIQTCLFLISFIFVFFKQIDTFVNFLLVCFILWPINKIHRSFIEKGACPSPPKPPVPISGLLKSEPVMFLNYDFDHYKLSSLYNEWQGYPPDWSIRKTICRQRDDHKCQLCGQTEHLHVHHIKPVSYFSNHTLKNLIVLCRSCHMKQEYWNHNVLVWEHIRANRKFLVRAYTRKNGKVVLSHFSKRGKRGRFWKNVKNTRFKNLHK